MDKNLMYLCMAVTLAWLSYFLYLAIMDGKIRNLKRRLDAREDQDQ